MTGEQGVDKRSGLTYRRLGFIEGFLATFGHLSDGAFLGAAEEFGVSLDELERYERRDKTGDMAKMIKRVKQ